MKLHLSLDEQDGTDNQVGLVNTILIAKYSIEGEVCRYLLLSIFRSSSQIMDPFPCKIWLIFSRQPLFTRAKKPNLVLPRIDRNRSLHRRGWTE